MPKQTNFLSLVLPEKNEFVNSWNEPINQNSEDIDNWMEDLYNSLVGVSSTSTWASLRGDLSSLSARLNVSIRADGTIDISTAPDVIDMSTSEVRGQFSGPRARLNDNDHGVFEAVQPFPGGRFAPISPGGPSLGYPSDSLDAGVAFRSADFGAEDFSGLRLGSPMKPSAPGLVTGGGANLIISVGGNGNQVRFTGDSAPAVFNIDGYIFRIREQIDLDFSLLSPVAGNYIWFFVERNESSYASAVYRYNQDSGVATKDLRRRQSGADGITSGSVFTSATAKFSTTILGKVKAGDTLVIESGLAAGSYVIEAIDLTLTDTKLTIKGIFHADLGGLPWHIQDNSIPNIGAVVTDNAATTEPPFVAGRVYVGRARYVSGVVAPNPIVSFANCGVFVSPWTGVNSVTLSGSPMSVPHHLGVTPSSVEIQIRESITGEVYEALVERSVVTKMSDTNFPDPLAADTSTVTLLFPSLRWHTSNTILTIRLKNESSDPLRPHALFTDNAGVDKFDGEIRVVVRR